MPPPPQVVGRDADGAVGVLPLNLSHCPPSSSSSDGGSSGSSDGSNAPGELALCNLGGMGDCVSRGCEGGV